MRAVAGEVMPLCRDAAACRASATSFRHANCVRAAGADADETLITVAGGVMANSSSWQQVQLAAHTPDGVSAGTASGSFLSRLRARVWPKPGTSLTYPYGLDSLTPAAERHENIYRPVPARIIPGGQNRSEPAADFPALFASSETAKLTDDEPKTIRGIRELSQVAPFPCWPNEPRYVVFLTRNVDRFLTRLARANLFIWPVLFLFQTQIDTLWTAVFGKESVSHFAFIRGQYEYLVTSQKIEHFDPTRHPELAVFHILEIATWLAIAMCVTRLITGIAFLRQFDARYLILSRHPATNLFPLLIILAGWFLYLPTDLQLQTKTSYAVPMMAHFPKVYWSLVAMVYVGGSWGIVQFSHFVIWKVFRQKWPWARLWNPNVQSNGAQSREIS